MRPIYESIVLENKTSLKVECYGNDAKCNNAGWHIHPEYEIVYVKNGSGNLKIGNKTHLYNNGVLVFLGGNIPHSDFGNYEHRDSKEVVIQFSKEFIHKKLFVFPEFTNIQRLIALSKHVLIFNDAVKTHLAESFELFEQLDGQTKLVNFLSILDYLSNTKGYHKLFNTNLLPEFRDKESSRLKHIFDYINANYNKQITLQDVADKVGLTPNSFSRFFKKTTNKTFIDFVNEFKINRAMDFMNEGEISVNEAMHHAGFNSPSYFSKQFVKYQGITPTAYQKGTKSS